MIEQSTPLASGNSRLSTPPRGHAHVFPLKWTWLVELTLLLALSGLGLVLRLSNLTNPPLDFHPTRQLRSAIISRGMYYADLPSSDAQKRDLAIGIWGSMEAYEPPVLEHLVAFSYRILGGEQLWVARAYSSLFWVIGGLALYALVKRIFSPAAGVFSLAFYLILPWGVLASRSFQPDPWMVMWVLLAAWALYRWSESGARAWLWTLLAGAFCGLAVLIKAVAAFPIAGMIAFVLLDLLLEQGHFPRSILALIRKPQLWVFALIAALIPAFYYLGLGQRSSEFASFWIVSLGGLLRDRKFYIHWLGLIRGIMDVMVLFAAVLGVFLFPRRGRAVVGGLWLGYLMIGLIFPFQIYTHDYYSIILVPIVAISLGVYAHLVVKALGQQPMAWRVAFAFVFLAVSGYYAYVARSQLYAMDYSKEPIPWQIMGEKLPTDGTIIALTHDYGDRLKYYGWRSVSRLWPAQGDIELASAAGQTKIADFKSYFEGQTEGMSYFLVTLFGDLNSQPDLKAQLYEHYPIAQQGDGYVLFDLRSPKP